MPPTHSATSLGFFERNWRWFVLGSLFFATFLNYLDRQTLGNAADPICQEFGLDNAQRGELLAKFVYYYASAHLIVGPLGGFARLGLLRGRDKDRSQIADGRRIEVGSGGKAVVSKSTGFEVYRTD